MSPAAPLADRIATATGAAVGALRPLHGGDLSQVMRADLADGRVMAVKAGPRVATEARMLRRLAAAGAPVPAVLAEAEGLLCLQFLEETRPTRGAWEALGRALASLHAAAGPGFGWEEDYAFGPVAIANAPAGDWPAFWAERRLLPHVPDLPAPLAARVERLAASLGERLPRAPVPALLHGDLWTGNVLFSGSRAWLIDPASYRGHGEVDLAMLTLFGAQPAAFWQGYGAPEAGFAERRPLYQLWPALVHHALFGAGYLGLVTRLLDEAGA